MSIKRISVITSLYRCERYLQSYLHHLTNISNPEECELIFVHNDPTDEEKNILGGFKNPGFSINHIIVEREPLYSSWNRAISVATGKYITIWNVDDVRLPNSIQCQADLLDINPTAAMSYGNYTTVYEYGSCKGSVSNVPEFNSNRSLFLRKHYIGCFPLWRKDIHKDVGFFDEQFKLVADLDFQIRVARKYELVKVSDPLGYYLEGTPNNLSSNYKLQDYEHTALHLRYGNFDLIHLTYLNSVIKNFKFKMYKWYGAHYPINEWYERDESHYAKVLLQIITPIVKLPRHLARRYLRQVARKYLKYHLLKARASYTVD